MTGKHLLAAAIVALTTAQAVNATTISATIGGSALAGYNVETFDSLTPKATTVPNGDTYALTALSVSLTPDAAVVKGTTSTYAAPASDSTTYLTSGKSGYQSAPAGGQVTLSFTHTQNYLGLLWGSIDSYNTIRFYNGASLVYTVLGSTVLSQNPSVVAGNQGASGTAYVNITDLPDFTSAVFTSSSYALEFDNIAYNVPDGATTMMLLGSSLFGIGALRRRYSR